MTFAKTVKSVEKQNLQRLKTRAILANRLAKATTGRARRGSYRVKNKAVGQLFLKGWAFVDDVSLFPELLVGVTFASGGRLHAKPQFMTPQAQELVLAQIENLFRTRNQPSRFPARREHIHE